MDESTSTSPEAINESIQVLMAGLPVPVRNFLQSPQRDQISLALSQKYQLHTDQAGVFEQAYIYMLLGITTPDEFVTELTEASIPAETVQQLAKDVNEQVFIPLRNAEQQATPAPLDTAPVAAPQPMAAPQPYTTPAPQPIPTAAPVPLPTYAPPTPLPQAPLGATAPDNLPLGHTMAADMAAMQRQAESAASLGVAPQIPQPQWGSAPVPPQPQWAMPPQGMTYGPPPMPQQVYMPPGYWPAQPMQAYPVQPPQPVYQYMPPAPQPPAPASPPPAPVTSPSLPPQPIPEPLPLAPDRTQPAPPSVPGQAVVGDSRAQAHDRFGLDPYRESI